MKIIEPNNIDKDQVELHAQQQVKKQVHVLSVRRINGLTLFRFNYQTRVIDQAPIEKHFDVVKNKEVSKVKYEDGYAYCQALNIKNAKRKFIKLIKNAIATAGKNKASS